jgi:hypothetical protein
LFINLPQAGLLNKYKEGTPTLFPNSGTKFIFVTGGVVSSLGKGIASTKAKRRLHAGWQRGC